MACFTSTDRGVTQPSGVIGPLGGTHGGSGGGTLRGTYRLQKFRDTAPPLRIFYDSTIHGAHDTVFSAAFDSSFISLNTDSSAREIDYLTVRDIRADSSINRTVFFGDTTHGTWSASGTTVTLTRQDTVGGVHNVVEVFTAASNTLTTKISYRLYNTAGGLVTTDTATVVYGFSGPPYFARMREPSAGRATAAPPARRPRLVTIGSRGSP